ncbi:MAG: glycosyltransferase family 39 protein [Lachnospiraceae bacterium]|nr:glycosyltransferase family 39 protein [Lachnospiraceae bacterium]
MELDDLQILVMAGLLTIVGFTAIYCWRLHYEVEGIRLYRKEKRIDWSNIVLLLAVAFVIKSILSVYYEGHGVDMNCFYSWSDMIFDNGITKFYHLDSFTDYPPGYMAMLWVIAGIRRLFSIETASLTGRFLIKLIPMLADIGAGVVLYLIAKKKFSELSALLLSVTYVLNPLIVMDSSAWGQADSVFTLCVLLTGYFCMEQKRIPAYFVFAAGILVKPQTMIFTPILIWTIIEQVFLKDFNTKKLIRDLIGGLSAIGAMFLFITPFGVGKVISQYIDTMGSYEYCTVNAYNFWALLGKNWAPQTDKFLFLECRQWGTLAILAAVALSGFIFFRLKEDKSKYFLSMSVIVSTMFLFSVRMHERYLFPITVLMFAAFLVKPTKELFFTYVGFTFVQLINVGHILYLYVEFESTGPEGGLIGLTALLTLGVYAYMYFATFSKTELEDLKPAPESRKKKKAGAKNYIERPIPRKEKEEPERRKFSILTTKKMKKFTKWDWIVLGSILVVYSAFALYDLGKMSAPETDWVADGNGSVIQLDLGENKKVDMLHAYLGRYEERKFTLDVSQDGVSYERVGQVVADSVFAWNNMTVEDGDAASYNLAKEYRYLKLTSDDNDSILRELVITDKDGNILTPVNTSEYPELFDEQDEYERTTTFRSGTYFDEIYHARTAYEMTQPGVYCYENTHPPLGKFLISIGIRIFGMNPFGWRIVGVIFGILMLPFMYLFGRRLFGCRTWAAGVLTFLFAFDFMHFTQTRISTIDVYGTFFIIAMFYFMLRYAQTSFYDTPLWKTFIPLGLSAIMMGLGCASKWTAVYAAAGLGIFFFTIMGVRYYEYRLAQKNPSGVTAGISHESILEKFKKNFIGTIAFCVLFFIVIAGLIYLLSYIPFDNTSGDGLFKQMLDNQRDMFNYHSTLTSTHPYSSTWYEWPTMIRPVFYYSQTVADGLKEGISAFGNPLVWWAGIPAVLYMIYLIFREKDRCAIFLVFAYLVQYVPWMLVDRCIFAYHYFPSVPFVAMMIVYTMVRLVKKDKKWLKWVFIYCAAAFILFLMFYPVLSGQPVAYNYIRDALKWLPDWVLA